MAQFIEAVAIIKISKLVKDGEVANDILNSETVEQFIAVLEELVDDPKALVEVIRAEE